MTDSTDVNRELMEVVRELKTTLASAGLDLHAIDRRLIRIEELVVLSVDVRKDHEKRIRTVERWAYGIPPAILLGLIALVERLWR